jgi:hypothetical protein
MLGMISPMIYGVPKSHTSRMSLISFSVQTHMSLIWEIFVREGTPDGTAGVGYVIRHAPPRFADWARLGIGNSSSTSRAGLCCGDAYSKYCVPSNPYGIVFKKKAKRKTKNKKKLTEREVTWITLSITLLAIITPSFRAVAAAASAAGVVPITNQWW